LNVVRSSFPSALRLRARRSPEFRASTHRRDAIQVIHSVHRVDTTQRGARPYLYRTSFFSYFHSIVPARSGKDLLHSPPLWLWENLIVRISTHIAQSNHTRVVVGAIFCESHRSSLWVRSCFRPRRLDPILGLQPAPVLDDSILSLEGSCNGNAGRLGSCYRSIL
jgi:hypothetical protein